MNNPILNIPGPGDKKYGFLNPSATGHSFILEGKKWPTVEHYILAKMFEGTILEEKIRQSKSVVSARMLSRKRNMIVDEGFDGIIIQNVHGPDNIQKRDDWSTKLENQYMEAAFKAKFEQHSKLKLRLLQTEGFTFQNTVGKILLKIRDSMIDKPREKEKVVFIPIQEDIKGADRLSNDEEKLVGHLMQMAKWISSLEGSKIIFPGMMEDVVYNIWEKDKSRKIMMAINEVSKYVSRDWNIILQNQPKYEKIISRLRLLDFCSGTHKIKICIFVANLIKWLRYDSKEMGNTLSIVSSKKIDDIFLMPICRPYRKPFYQKVKKEIPSQNPNERGKIYISLFKPLDMVKDDYKNVVTILEKCSNDKRTTWLSKFEKMNMEDKKVAISSLLNGKEID
jgi:predicted NAD-dependent protein-ADP-ribosyltransferase YbiA (DUF1768 family)